MLNVKSNNENIETLLEKNYNEIIKEKKNEKYLKMLDQSMNEAKAGKFLIKSIEELEE